MDTKGINSTPTKTVSFDDSTIGKTGKEGQFSGRRVKAKPLSIKDLFLKGLNTTIEFLSTPFKAIKRKINNSTSHNARVIENLDYLIHNSALRNTRVIENLDYLVACNRDDMKCYRHLNNIMQDAKFDKTLLKNKTSNEIADILLKKAIINQQDVADFKQHGVDLDGSPFW